MNIFNNELFKSCWGLDRVYKQLKRSLFRIIIISLVCCALWISFRLQYYTVGTMCVNLEKIVYFHHTSSLILDVIFYFLFSNLPTQSLFNDINYKYIIYKEIMVLKSFFFFKFLSLYKYNSIYSYTYVL